MITQDEVEKAVIYLAESAKEYAQAVGHRVWLEEKRKIVKASLYSQQEGRTATDRENAAYAHPDYQSLIDTLRMAVEDEQILRAYRSAAETRIEVWRSQESSRRAANV